MLLQQRDSCPAGQQRVNLTELQVHPPPQRLHLRAVRVRSNVNPRLNEPSDIRALLKTVACRLTHSHYHMASRRIFQFLRERAIPSASRLPTSRRATMTEAMWEPEQIGIPIFWDDVSVALSWCPIAARRYCRASLPRRQAPRGNLPLKPLDVLVPLANHVPPRFRGPLMTPSFSTRYDRPVAPKSDGRSKTRSTTRLTD